MESNNTMHPHQILVRLLARPKDIKPGTLLPIKFTIYETKEEKETIGEITRSEPGNDNTRYEWKLEIEFLATENNRWRFFMSCKLDQYVEVYKKLD